MLELFKYRPRGAAALSRRRYVDIEADSLVGDAVRYAAQVDRIRAERRLAPRSALDVACGCRTRRIIAVYRYRESAITAPDSEGAPRAGHRAPRRACDARDLERHALRRALDERFCNRRGLCRVERDIDGAIRNERVIEAGHRIHCEVRAGRRATAPAARVRYHGHGTLCA